MTEQQIPSTPDRLRAQRDALRWPHKWPVGGTRAQRQASICLYCRTPYVMGYGRACIIRRTHYQSLVTSGKVNPAHEDPYSDEWLAAHP